MSSAIATATPTAALVFDEPTEFVDRSLPTASWWDRYEILPGRYEFEWVNTGGAPWNPDPEVVTPGFIANIGPYYGKVTVQARLLEEYRVSSLLGYQVAGSDIHVEPEVRTLTRTVYAYQLPGCPKGERGRNLEHFLGGRVERIECGVCHDEGRERGTCGTC
jgi:hypothetical protein